MLLTNSGVGQQPLSKYEVWWIIWHPFAAVQVKKLLPESRKITAMVQKYGLLDQYENGGKSDAFRHIYTMAFLGQRLNIKKLRRLGVAHEKGNKRYFEKGKTEFGERPDSLACVMDLRNNEVGFDTGRNNREMQEEDLKNLVLELIKVGQGWYLKRNALNEYVTCENKPIIASDYAGKWFLPKCLIRTNE